MRAVGLLLAGATLVAGCGPATAPVAPAPPPTAPASSRAGTPPAAVPEPSPPVVIDEPAPPAAVGAGLAVAPFRPGRYAMDVRKTLRAVHARNWVSEQARSSFVLSLAADGTTTACRGQRVDWSNRGPRMDRSVRLREQQGYRGRWQRREPWIEVELGLDDGTCPQLRAYADAAHAPARWRLQCLSVTPRHHPVLTAPALVCRLAGGAPHRFEEGFAHLVPGVLPGRWLVLGAEPGLVVRWHDSTVPPGGKPPQIAVTPAAEPVGGDTWTKPWSEPDPPGRD